jgi:hypothetical protein
MRAVPSLLLAPVAALLLGCTDGTGPSLPSSRPDPRPSETPSFRVLPAQATLSSGASLQLTIDFAGDPALTAGPVIVAWYSSDQSVASVSPNGLVRAIRGGEAAIVASWGTYSATALVTVAGPMKKNEDPLVCLKRIPAPERFFRQC